MSKLYKLEFYVPENDLEKVKTAIFAAGAGRIGDYDSCCWQTKGIGQFRPLDGSQPFIGSHGKIEKVDEFKVEMVCDGDKLDQIIVAMLESHPYEEVAYQYWEVNKV